MIKSYTDLEQSKKLAKILPLESADMWWNYYSVTTEMINLHANDSFYLSSSSKE